MKVIPDTPLTDISEDILGREPIVELIVDSINNLVSSNHPCTAYGIYGKWGEGKTSLMNFVKSRLVKQGKDDCISIIEFNPWLVNNDDSLLREFFGSLMTSADNVVREAFRKYGSMAILASKTIVNAIAPGIGSALGMGLELAKTALEDSRDTLSDLKEKASKAIVDSKRHLVIMIDDVDRLDKEELHSVFRLIRLVADFDNCIYLVALDPQLVSSSIRGFHGEGTTNDGLHYLDKIIQIPITLPRIPKVNLQGIVRKELENTLEGYILIDSFTSICDVVTPFFQNIRDLKRYNNQLRFVLPHLKKEVNIKDLCILEAIKLKSPESYHRIYECRSSLMREAGQLFFLDEKGKEKEFLDRNYDEAKKYITNNLSGEIKGIITHALDELFGNRTTDAQKNLDNKCICTDIYFSKYFTLTVPSDVIPDTKIDSLIPFIQEKHVDKVVSQINDWLQTFPASEIKRAALYSVRAFSVGSERCTAAALIAKSISMSDLAKGIPPSLPMDSLVISSFVVNQIIKPYMFIQLEYYGGVTILDKTLMDETLAFIFNNCELNYCLQVLYSFDDYLSYGVYDGTTILRSLISRFKSLSVTAQFEYSKYLLLLILKKWKDLDSESFNAYADSLFRNSEISYLSILDKFIDGTHDSENISSFVRLFSSQVSIINDLIDKDDPSVLEKDSVKYYKANYASILPWLKKDSQETSQTEK